MREIGFTGDGWRNFSILPPRSFAIVEEGVVDRRRRRWPRKISAVISPVYLIIDYRIEIAWNMISRQVWLNGKRDYRLCFCFRPLYESVPIR